MTATSTGSRSVVVPVPQRCEYSEDGRRFPRDISTYPPKHTAAYPTKYFSETSVSTQIPQTKKEQSSGTYVKTSKPTSNYTKFCHATSNAWMLAELLKPNIKQRTTTSSIPLPARQAEHRNAKS